MNEKIPSGYICAECARELQATWPKGHCATFHVGECVQCGKDKAVCSTGDWDWPDRIQRGMRD